MKNLLVLFLFSFFLIEYTLSQVVTTNPYLPTDNKQVVITFDATQGNKGLMGSTGDVYAHTGVITDKSTSASDWKYVKAGWTVNIAACKLTSLGSDKYQLTIGPSIREFYGVPATEKILKLAFVFRSADGSNKGLESSGSDIFASVYEDKLSVTFAKPSALFTFANLSENIPIEINAIEQDSIQLIADNSRLISTTASTLSYSLTATGTGTHMLIAKAFKNQQFVADTSYYITKTPVETASVPAGAIDGINYIDNQTATLVLFAPYKTSVYVVGDFNNWMPDNNYQMKKDGDRFWITLTNLTPGQEYRYQYLIDGTLLIADPYTEKTSDPLDRYIGSDIYPGLLPYPAGKTSEITSVLQTGQTPYAWQSSNFSAPAKEKLVIYEILIRDFTEKHDIKTITDTIPYLKRLGINAIELMPFSEFEGNESWGYNPSFYFAPDKAYGTKNDYKAFIDACHQNGIAVIMDLVLNHSYSQSPLARMYMDGDKPSVQNPWYNRFHNMANLDAQWGFDFNHESIYTKKLVDSIAAFWMNEYRVDGFRFDFTKGFTNTPYGTTSWASDYDASRIAILKRIASEIWKRKANAYVIMEHLAVNLEETELANHGIMLWGNMSGAYGEAASGLVTNNRSNFSDISYKQRGWNSANLVGYMESHDEERLMYKLITKGNSYGTYNIKTPDTALRRVELAATFFLTVPGPKMIWQFGELGYDVSIDFDGRLSPKPIRWNYFDQPARNRLFSLFQYLIKLKKEEPLFSTSDFALNVTEPIKTIRLSLNGQHAMIVGNFDVTAKSTAVPFPAAGKWYDHFTGDSITLTTTDYEISLAPGEYHLFTSSKLASFPSVPTDAPVIETSAIRVYPNPFTDYILIETPENIRKISIYNMAGKLLKEQYGDFQKPINLSKLSTGVYLMTVWLKSGQKEVIKLVK
ncbi:MAG TPA: alpha-amylase family glycosyl hydrolase [Bacteroidales bacterium]|nr:alpha-amylase family glycosyl hydrolase [Bacteroidales bacterium]